MLDLRNLAPLALSFFLLVQAGCTPAVQTTPMAIDRVRYDPVVARFPASIGVYFPADFYDNNFYHTTADDYQLTFHNNPAAATRQALDLAFEASFAEVRYLDSLQQGLAEEDLAFVVVPSIVAMPSHLDAQIIAVGLIYQFEFYAGGKHLSSWQVAGLDFRKKAIAQPTQSPGSAPGQAPLPRKISAAEFDAVARGAVWDALSVLLTGLDQQLLLTGRLPAPRVSEKVAAQPPSTAEGPAVLAMVGAVYDQDQDPDRARLERCLLEQIEDNDLSIKPVTQGDLRDRLYPWLSRSNYPKGPNELASIISEPAVRQRLRQLGIRYVLSWDGETVQSPFSGPFYVTPYGVIGYESADKVSTIRADLLTVADGRIVTSFQSTREGTDTVLGLLLSPLPIREDTEGKACAEITHAIDGFLQTQRAANRFAAGNRTEN